MSPPATVALSLALARRDGHPEVPPRRVGVGLGSVVSFEGDVFGTAVNRAARIVAQGLPGTVATSVALRDVHADGASRLSIGVRVLKGIGDVELFEVRAAV